MLVNVNPVIFTIFHINKSSFENKTELLWFFLFYWIFRTQTIDSDKMPVLCNSKCGKNAILKVVSCVISTISYCLHHTHSVIHPILSNFDAISAAQNRRCTLQGMFLHRIRKWNPCNNPAGEFIQAWRSCSGCSQRRKRFNGIGLCAETAERTTQLWIEIDSFVNRWRHYRLVYVTFQFKWIKGNVVESFSISFGVSFCCGSCRLPWR